MYNNTQMLEHVYFQCVYTYIYIYMYIIPNLSLPTGKSSHYTLRQLADRIILVIWPFGSLVIYSNNNI